MKNLLFLLSALFIIMSLTNCSKDKDNALPDYAPAVQGTWKLLTPWSNQNMELSGITIKSETVTSSVEYGYLQLHSDLTYSELICDNFGFREKHRKSFMVTGNQIVLGLEVYNYTISNDTLILTKPDARVKLLKDNNSGIDSSNWVKNLSASIHYKTPVNRIMDICSDGNFIYYPGGGYADYIYKINPANGFKDSISYYYGGFGIEFDGTNFWTSRYIDKYLNKINKTTGSFISKSTDIGYDISAIACDSIYLWTYSKEDYNLVKYNINTNSVVSTFNLKYQYIEGAAFKNGYLYVTNNGMIHKCATSPFKVVGTFKLINYSIKGIAFIGSSVWVTTQYIPNYQFMEIIKVNGID